MSKCGVRHNFPQINKQVDDEIADEKCKIEQVYLLFQVISVFIQIIDRLSANQYDRFCFIKYLDINVCLTR